MNIYVPEAIGKLRGPHGVGKKIWICLPFPVRCLLAQSCCKHVRKIMVSRKTPCKIPKHVIVSKDEALSQRSNDD